MRIADERAVRLATAETFTGGELSWLLSSFREHVHCVECAIVAYSNRSKTSLLGVDGDLLREEGPVSEGVVRFMAMGALRVSQADLAIAISGCADEGALDETPGLVHFALANRSGVQIHKGRHYRDTTHAELRKAVLDDALHLLLTYLLTLDFGTKEPANLTIHH